MLTSNRAAVVLASLLMYARHPATPNSPGWVFFMVPADLLPECEEALADGLEATSTGGLTQCDMHDDESY